MRLALVIYGSLDTVSGGYLYDRQLVKHLRACGDNVDLISLPWRSYATHLTHNFSLKLHRQLTNSNYDLILQDELNHPSLFLANRILSKDHPPRIAIIHHLRSSEHCPSLQNNFYRWVEKQYLNSVAGFIFNSHTTQTVVEKLIAKRLPQVTAHPGGNRLRTATLDPEQVRQRATRSGSLKILFVGNLIPRKGLDTLLTALTQINSGWELNIVGSLQIDPAYVTRLQKRVNANNIQLLGALTDSSLTNYFAQSDVLIVPSTYEGFGIVYLEGMAFGLPAIATTAGAAHEIIRHGKDGYLIEPHDSATLAHHIQQLIQDRNLLLQLSLAAREKFLTHPTWEQSAETIREFLLRRTKS